MNVFTEKKKKKLDIKCFEWSLHLGCLGSLWGNEKM